MRTRRFRPSFDALTLRLAPSGGSPLGGFAFANVPMQTAAMPGDRTTIIGGEHVPINPIDVNNPDVDPTQWGS